MELNEKNKEGNYPLLCATSFYYNNIEIVKLLIGYANQHQIILELNEKDINGDYILLKVISKNNIEIFKLLIDYALKQQITLEYEKWRNVDEPEIKNLLHYYEK